MRMAREGVVVAHVDVEGELSPRTLVTRESERERESWVRALSCPLEGKGLFRIISSVAVVMLYR